MSTIIDGSASVTINSGAVLGITSGTAVASTSGTSIDFTSIPSWVKRITVMLNGVSTNGTANFVVQIGSGSYVTSGYVCQISAATSIWGGSISNFTNGFQIYNVGAASDAAYGHAILTLVSGNTWIYSGNVISTAPRMSTSSGGYTLSGALDRIRLIASATGSPADTFDAGSINILYE
jgi:hypothetical protein